MHKLQTDLIVETTSRLISKRFVALEKLLHYLIGIFEIVSGNGIGCGLIVASDLRLVLHNRYLRIVVLPNALLDLAGVHVIEDALAVLEATRKVTLIAIAISCGNQVVAYVDQGFEEVAALP